MFALKTVSKEEEEGGGGGHFGLTLHTMLLWSGGILVWNIKVVSNLEDCAKKQCNLYTVHLGYCLRFVFLCEYLGFCL